MWSLLQPPASDLLVPARLSVHWASQLPAAAAASVLPPQDDYSHTNLGWDAAARALVSHAIDGVRTGLRVDDLTLVLFRDNAVTAEFSLAGQSLGAGQRWLSAALGDEIGAAVRFDLFDHDMPPHPVTDDALFEGPSQAQGRAQLATWIANAASALQDHVQGDDRASPVRLWPHHFDIATLRTLDRGDDPEQSTSINFGVSLGDTTYALPYVYVSPWPKPASAREAPALPVGGWHHDGFFAAVLRGEALAEGDAAEQRARCEAFLAAADTACRTLLATDAAPRR